MGETIFFLVCVFRGACYYDTANNVCDYGDALDVATRNANLATWADQITAAGLPWLYWQVLPNADPHVSLDRVLRIFYPFTNDSYAV